MSDIDLTSENLDDSKKIGSLMKNDEVKKDSLKMTDRNLGMVIFSWIIMLLASSLSIILWRELGPGEPFWWPFIILTFLAIIFIISLVKKTLKPQRSFSAILLIIFIFGYGGGWKFGIIPTIRESLLWTEWMNSMPWALSSILIHLLRLSPAFVILLFLFLTGRKRKDFYLMIGEIRANVEP